MKLSVDVKGTDKLLNALRGMATTTDVKNAVRLNGSQMQRKAQRHAPVDTGTLKRSIGLEISDAGYTAIIKPTAEYAAYVEYGTRYMGAQPFMRPAYHEQEPVFIKDMERLLKSLK